MDDVAPSTRSPKSGRRAFAPLVRRGLLFALLALLVAVVRPAETHVRAAGLLRAFADPERAARAPVVVEERTVDGLAGRTRARLYRPHHPPRAAMVLVHGVHQLGIEEPRLVRFSRALAAAGVAVLTPELRPLTEYRIAPEAIAVIGDAARALATEARMRRVAVMGMSFGGGLALMAAADPRSAEAIGMVVAIGAHEDLARVSRFFATDDAEEWDGSHFQLKAHDYGTLILIYQDVSAFFEEADVPVAREALRAWLAEDRTRARSLAESASPAARRKLELLFAEQTAALRDELLRDIDAREGAMGTVSPHGKLASVSVPVFLLHGAGDRVVPASETRWLAHEIAPDRLEGVLVSPALVHVELKEPSVADELRIVHIMARILAVADGLR